MPPVFLISFPFISTVCKSRFVILVSVYKTSGTDKVLKKILIIKAGTKLPSLDNVAGDFEDWILSAMDVPAVEADVVSVFEGFSLPHPSQCKAVVITGSDAMISGHSEWIEVCAIWLRDAVESQIPVMGICFGHQLLAYALGGDVANNPAGIEAGSVEAILTSEAANDLLLQGMDKMMVQASHRQCVTRLPDGAVCLAKTSMDQYHAFRVGSYCWGLQFHPEFSANITRHYIQYYQADLQSAGRNTEDMMAACVETLQARACLKKFSKWVKT